MQETTGLIILDGKDAITKQLNRDTLKRFEQLIFEKQKQLMDGVIIPHTVKRQRTCFFEYFEHWMELNPSKERRNISTLNHLRKFWTKDSLPVTEVTEDFLKLFKIYLEKHLTGETPYGYFKACKKVIRQAVKESLFTSNPATDVSIKKQSNDPKETLTKDEVLMLEQAYCGNDNVKRAFLFSCYTGIRFCDIKALKWQHITSDNRMKIVQVKTKQPLDQLLIQKAMGLLGERGANNQSVFLLPSCNATNKNLRLWSKRAGLEKKITFHCSRHSFATNVFEGTRDILTTSKALGHRSIKESMRYTRVAQTTVDSALMSLI